jgi:hypothetical protein
VSQGYPRTFYRELSSPAENDSIVSAADDTALEPAQSAAADRRYPVVTKVHPRMHEFGWNRDRPYRPEIRRIILISGFFVGKRVILMKLNLTLHATAELQTDLSLEETEKRLRASVGAQFHGKETDGTWQLSHQDHNFFRPALRVTLGLDGDGTVIRTEYRADKALLIFMCAWTLLVIVLALLRNPLLLLTLLLFWGAVIVGFSAGVKSAGQDLMSLLEAYEVMG